MNVKAAWLDAAEAAALLGVNRATLYAYVSRGFVRSQARPGSSRARGYAREDVERLQRRTEERRDPDKAAGRALQWGVPVLESSITMIDGHRLYYRGHDAARLAQTRSIQEVASLIWTGRFETAFPAEAQGARTAAAAHRAGSRLPFVPRAQSWLAAASTLHTAQSGSVAFAGWRILQLLTAAATVSRLRGGNSGHARTEDLAIDRALARAWRVTGPGVDVLRAALILCADHELNVSSFTARCVASAGSSPYAVVIAGLAALEGTRHGGLSARVESMLQSMRRERNLRAAIADRLRRGEAFDGFGHPLYPHGDPRATMLFDQLQERYPHSAELTFAREFAVAAAAAVGERPNLDFALAAVARVLRLPPGAPLTLFAIGRAIGWIGQAIEQYDSGQLIRPRARYVGVVPNVE